MGGGPVAAAADTATTIKARTRFFGAENVDQRTGAVRRDRVIFSWFGVTNFALAIRGHVLLLDAWIPRGLHSGYVPTTTDELATLRGCAVRGDLPAVGAAARRTSPAPLRGGRRRGRPRRTLRRSVPRCR